MMDPALLRRRRWKRRWTPRSEPGLAAEWPTQDATYVESTPVTPAVADDDQVGFRRDIRDGSYHLTQATGTKKPLMSGGVPAFDGLDDLLKANLSLSMASRWKLCLAAWAKDGSDKIKLDELSILPGEYGWRIGAGDNRQVAAPGNFNPDSFAFVARIVPHFAWNDGKEHEVLNIVSGSDRALNIYKTSSNTLQVITIRGGTQKTVSFTLSGAPFAAGQPIWVGAQLNAGTLTGYYAGPGATAFTTGTATSVGSVSGTWTGHIGQYSAQTYNLEGSLNLLLTNDGSDASAITDRFNAGAGMALGGDMGWLARVSGNGSRHGENLVLHVGGNADGSGIQIDTAHNALSLLAGTATGRVDLSSGNYLTTADPGAAADGLSAASWAFKYSPDQVALGVGAVGRWDGGSDNQWIAYFPAGGATVSIYIASAGGDNTNYVTFTISGGLVVGTEYWFHVTYNAGTVALYYKVLDSTTREFGAQQTPSPSVTGTIPVTLRSCALGYSFGVPSVDVVPTDGKLDDVRSWYGKVLTSAEADADFINEPGHGGCPMPNHWWPFDGDGTDVIGGLTATWTGTPAYVDDGRHHLGRFERFTRQGQKFSNAGNSKYMETADPGAGADALTKATWINWFTLGSTTNAQRLFARAQTADNQFAVTVGASDWSILIATSGSDTTTLKTGGWGSTLSAGTRIMLAFVFDGTQGTAENRLVAYFKFYDPATGTWGTITASLGSMTGTIPTSLTSSAQGYSWFKAGGFGIPADGLFVDETRVWNGVAFTQSEVDAETIYATAKAGLTYRWKFNGNGTEEIAGLTANVTGSVLDWYDGRQPEGWEVGTTAECDRATGTNQSPEGTFGVRVKATVGGLASSDSVSKATAALTAGRWVVFCGSARETAGTALVRMEGSAFTGTKDAAIPTQATMASVGRADRVNSSAAAALVLQPGTSAEAYLDNLRALQLATVSLSVSTSGVPSRVIWSASKDGVTLPYVYAAIADDEKLEVGVRNDAGTRTEASSSGAVTIGPHSWIFDWDPDAGTAGELYVYLDTVLVATLAPPAGTYTGLDQVVFGALVGLLAGHHFDERIGYGFLHLGSLGYEGSDATTILNNHNFLAEVTPGLAAA